MYSELNCFEEALKHFGTRVEIITAMEVSKRISPDDAYKMIKDELKEVKSVVNNLRKMSADSLKVNQNKDGSFDIEWDKEDPNWSWLNTMTSKEIQSFMEQAIKDELNSHE